MKFKLYIKRKKDATYLAYGTGSMRYIRELLFDYIVENDLYNQDEVEFKIERL